MSWRGYSNSFEVLRKRTDQYIMTRIRRAIEAYEARDYAEVSTIRATLCAQLPLLHAQDLISADDWHTIYRFYNRMLGGYNIAW